MAGNDGVNSGNYNYNRPQLRRDLEKPRRNFSRTLLSCFIRRFLVSGKKIVDDTIRKSDLGHVHVFRANDIGNAKEDFGSGDNHVGTVRLQVENIHTCLGRKHFELIVNTLQGRDWNPLAALILLVDKLHLFAENPFWLVGDNAIFAIVAAQVWRGWSFHFIMILAGLQTIPTHLYEAATIDGAGPLTKFRVITLPELKPILTTLIVVNGMKIFNEFETTFVMLSENPPASANVMSVNIYKQAFGNFNFGVASANAVTWVLVIFAISLCLNKLLRLKED